MYNIYDDDGYLWSSGYETYEDAEWYISEMKNCFKWQGDFYILTI